jgi:hypothetical protein
LQYFERTGWNDYTNSIGPPLQKCPNCAKDYRTGMNYWHNLSKSQKNTNYIKLAFSIFYTSFIYVCLIFILLFSFSLFYKDPEISNFLDKLFNYIETWVILFFLFLPYTSIRHLRVFNELKNMKER